jgi:hypothetical protein
MTRKRESFAPHLVVADGGGTIGDLGKLVRYPWRCTFARRTSPNRVVGKGPGGQFAIADWPLHRVSGARYDIHGARVASATPTVSTLRSISGPDLVLVCSILRSKFWPTWPYGRPAALCSGSELVENLVSPSRRERKKLLLVAVCLAVGLWHWLDGQGKAGDDQPYDNHLRCWHQGPPSPERTICRLSVVQ